MKDITIGIVDSEGAYITIKKADKTIYLQPLDDVMRYAMFRNKDYIQGGEAPIEAAWSLCEEFMK